MSEVSLKIGGKIYGGWTGIRISRSIEHLAGEFDLSLTDRYPSDNANLSISGGMACSVQVDGETVITGYTDDYNPSFAGKSHEIAVSGRDVTGDLVDCSAVNKPGEWLGRKLDQIAADLAKPFGIPVITNTDIGDAFAKFRLEEGETVYEALNRACAMRSVLPVSDGKGNLLITKPGTARAGVRLVEGKNILSASAEYSAKDRYAQYIVKAQQPGSDQLDADQSAHVRAEAKDAGVKRYRPLLILAEQSADLKTATKRAEWEANVRAARGQRVRVRVQGWREEGATGALWKPNRLVAVEAPSIKYGGNLLVSMVTFSLGNTGTTAELVLVPPASFDTLPPKEKKLADTGALQWIN